MEYVLSILTFLVTGTCLFSSRVIPSFSFPGEYINIGKYACYGRLMMLLSPLFVCSGCIKDSCSSGSAGLLEPEGYAEITIDWGMDECPRGARFLFYDESGDLVKEEEGSDGSFRGSLPVGKYRIIVHNSDAEQVGYRGMDKYETAEIFSQSADMSMSYLLQVKDMITGQPYITEPSSVFAAGSCKEFGELDITDGGTLKATVNPVCVTRSMEFHFDVSSVENIDSLKGMLSGVAQGVFIASGKHNASSCCSVEFDILAGGI